MRFGTGELLKAELTMMSNERLETLHLRGNASVDFFNELFRPIDSEMADSVNLDEKTNSGISIKEVADGYVVTIDDFERDYDDAVIFNELQARNVEEMLKERVEME